MKRVFICFLRLVATALVLIGPGLVNLDLGIRELSYRTERQNVEFRAEFYNALKHQNTAWHESMRTVQFALKYRF